MASTSKTLREDERIKYIEFINEVIENLEALKSEDSIKTSVLEDTIHFLNTLSSECGPE
jgi:hypothetical protein